MTRVGGFVDSKVTVLVVIVDSSIGSLNLAVIGSPTGTFVGPSQHAGFVLTTVGGEVSRGAVVNDQILAAFIALPAKSFTPVVTVAVYDLEDDNGSVGSNVAVKPFDSMTPLR